MKEMKETVEISVVIPKRLKILVPRPLFEQFEQSVRDENLSAVVTEALREELKKIRFRSALEAASSKERAS